MRVAVAEAMRVAIAELKQETNSFVPFLTTLDTFRDQYVCAGEDVRTRFATVRVEMAAFMDVLREAGVEAVPLTAAFAMASGPVARDAFEVLMGDLLARLRDAGRLDGVLLALHGAMVLEDEPDAEAEIIARVRAVVGPGLPIAVSLDLHGHVTPAMLQPDVAMIGYREYPHIDMYETGERTARLLLDWIAGRVRPVMAMAKRHMVVSPLAARTTEAPLSAIVAAGRAMEASGAILHASLFPVQPWLDIPDLGCAALVCADADLPAAQRAADELAGMFWAARDGFEPELTGLAEAIRIGLSSEGLTVVGDAGDTPSGGSAADGTAVLEALLAAGADRAGRLTYLTMADAEAAAEAAAAGVGKTVTLRLGHRRSGMGAPITVTGIVRTISDGRYVLHGPGASGMVGEMGLTVVLAIGDIRLNLRSVPHFEWDPGIHECVGLNPLHAALIFVKSPSHFRVSYGPIAARILMADTPGPTCGNMRNIAFTKVTRPFWPVDFSNSAGRA